MKVWPVLLDSRPKYFGVSSTEATLLGAPMGRTLLVSRLSQPLAVAGCARPTIVAPPGAPPDYRARFEAVVPGAIVVASARELAEALQWAEPSDLLLFVDPRCLPMAGWQLPSLLAVADEPLRQARHLVAHAADVAGTRESVNVDDGGLVRSVHRYYKPATWPFIAGVAASLVPMSSRPLPLTEIPGSLLELREQLVARGVPSHDVAIAGGAFDLGDEGGMLAAMERSVRDAVDEAAGPDGATTLLVGDGHVIDPTARFLGPVVVQSGARIEARCTIVGPTLVGPHARISADAVLAHVSVGAEAVVPAGRALRDRVWLASAESSIDAAATAVTERRTPSFPRQLARHGIHAAEPPPAPAAYRTPSRRYALMKRAFDVFVAATALVLLAPVLLVVAALVWIDSRGPIFFRDVREGVGGNQFACLKFRTMQVGASDLQRQLKDRDELDGPHFKMDSDPRTTRIGRWLRAANFDELPQLVNVLVGDMSLVGPRPSPFRENQICVPWREGRLSVRPGITGLWQVCRHDREAGDFHQWIEYDLLYVQHMSLVLDLKVLAVTILTLGGKYPVAVSRLLWSPVATVSAPPTTYAPDGTSAGALEPAEAPTRSAR
ncbi:MAG: sugar transferase [Acidobacteria bacterium]|nr:sugar transferase [Acidobacteriota bacterium]